MGGRRMKEERMSGEGQERARGEKEEEEEEEDEARKGASSGELLGCPRPPRVRAELLDLRTGNRFRSSTSSWVTRSCGRCSTTSSLSRTRLLTRTHTNPQANGPLKLDARSFEVFRFPL